MNSKVTTQPLWGAFLVVLASVLAITNPGVDGARALLQTYPTCGAGEQAVTLDASQLAFKNLTTGPGTPGDLAFDCNALYEGYSRFCKSNSVYTYINEVIASPPYLTGYAATPRPYISAYAKPADAALAVKQELYYLDLQTGSIFIARPASELPAGTTYPKFTEYPVKYDNSGRPDHDGDVSGKDRGHGGQYAFFFNEIRAAVQNVTSPPGGSTDAVWGCNPAVPALESLLQYLFFIQGISGDAPPPNGIKIGNGTPLVTGPLPDGSIPQ